MAIYIYQDKFIMYVLLFYNTEEFLRLDDGFAHQVPMNANVPLPLVFVPAMND